MSEPSKPPQTANSSSPTTYRLSNNVGCTIQNITSTGVSQDTPENNDISTSTEDHSGITPQTSEGSPQDPQGRSLFANQ
jgi:hypothetical protein